MKASPVTLELVKKFGKDAFEKATEFVSLADLIGDQESAKIFTICMVELTSPEHFGIK